MLSNESLNTEIVVLSNADDSLNESSSIYRNEQFSSDEEDKSDKNDSERIEKFGAQMFTLIASTVVSSTKFEPLPLLDQFKNEEMFSK